MSTRERIPALRFPVQADLTLPGSKSHANRAILCACLAEGTTLIRHATPCDDVVVMVENLQKMGFDLHWMHRARGELKIVGGMPHSSLTPSPSPEGRGEVLDCHNAGTALRFLLSLAALQPGEWVLTGDEHMRKRPIADLTHALRSLGAEISDTNGCPPITIVGGTVTGSKVRLKASVSSQYLSSLLMIAPCFPQGLTIEVDGPLTSSGYVDLTEKVMKDFGVQIERTSNSFIVRHQKYHSPTPKGAGTCPEDDRRVWPAAFYEIEGDWSAAGAWLVLNEITGSKISFTNLDPQSLQSDRALPQAIKLLHGKGDRIIDCSAIPDQVMNLALLAAFRNGKTTITGAANLRHKECDRLAVITSELRKTGIRISELSDGLIIIPPPQPFLRCGGGTPQTVIVLDPHHDHRMAMCFAILGLKRGGIEVRNPECCAKSYPQFFTHLKSILHLSRPIAIVGMRAAGKSGLARQLASRLKLSYVDIDAVFMKEHGPIKDFVIQKGWPAFRSAEEKLVEAFLSPSTIVSLGGGATESKKTRELLKKKAIVIWIQATKVDLINRLRSGKRPSLTDLPLDQEVHKLLVERAPNYKEVAHIMIPPGMPYAAQAPFAVKALRAFVSSSF